MSEETGETLCETQTNVGGKTGWGERAFAELPLMEIF